MKKFIENTFNNFKDSIKNIDLNKVKRAIIFTSFITIIILVILLMKSCEKQEFLKQEVKTIIALNDSLKLVAKTDTTIIYSNKVITLSPRDIIREKIPINDPQKKVIIEQLAKEKNLVAYTQTQIQKRDSIIEIMKAQTPNDSLCWATYNFRDSTSHKNLEYSGTIKVDSNIHLSLLYLYKLKMNTSITNSKKGTLATYTFDDPNVVLTSATTLWIPIPPISKKQKVLNVLIPTLSGLAAGAVGYTIGHYVIPQK